MGWTDYIPGVYIAKQSGFLDPRTEGEYAGVDRNNFNLPGGDARAADLQGRMNGAAPVSQDSAFRADQQALVNRLRGQMSGQDSISAIQARDMSNRNVAQAQGFAAGARPGGAQAASLQAAETAGRANMGLANQSLIAGIAERNAAANALGNVVQGARGQDLANNQFNVGANLQQQGINQGWGQQELQNAQMQQQGGIAYEGNRAARAGAQMQAPTQGEQLAGLAMGGAQAYAASDERNKTGIRSGDSDTRAFLDRLHPATYSYRNQGPVAPPGQHTGVMAQDIEQSPAGRGAVQNTPQGKVVDYGQLGGVMLASLADVHQRLKQVEGISARPKPSGDAKKGAPKAPEVPTRRVYPGEMAKHAPLPPKDKDKK